MAMERKHGILALALVGIGVGAALFVWREPQVDAGDLHGAAADRTAEDEVSEVDALVSATERSAQRDAAGDAPAAAVEVRPLGRVVDSLWAYRRCCEDPARSPEERARWIDGYGSVVIELCASLAEEEAHAAVPSAASRANRALLDALLLGSPERFEFEPHSKLAHQLDDLVWSPYDKGPASGDDFVGALLAWFDDVRVSGEPTVAKGVARLLNTHVVLDARVLTAVRAHLDYCSDKADPGPLRPADLLVVLVSAAQVAETMLGPGGKESVLEDFLGHRVYESVSLTAPEAYYMWMMVAAAFPPEMGMPRLFEKLAQAAAAPEFDEKRVWGLIEGVRAFLAFESVDYATAQTALRNAFPIARFDELNATTAAAILELSTEFGGELADVIAREVLASDSPYREMAWSMMSAKGLTTVGESIAFLDDRDVEVRQAAVRDLAKHAANGDVGSQQVVREIVASPGAHDPLVVATAMLVMPRTVESRELVAAHLHSSERVTQIGAVVAFASMSNDPAPLWAVASSRDSTVGAGKMALMEAMMVGGWSASPEFLARVVESDGQREVRRDALLYLSFFDQSAAPYLANDALTAELGLAAGEELAQELAYFRASFHGGPTTSFWGEIRRDLYTGGGQLDLWISGGFGRLGSFFQFVGAQR